MKKQKATHTFAMIFWIADYHYKVAIKKITE